MTPETPTQRVKAIESPRFVVIISSASTICGRITRAPLRNAARMAPTVMTTTQIAAATMSRYGGRKPAHTSMNGRATSARTAAPATLKSRPALHGAPEGLSHPMGVATADRLAVRRPQRGEHESGESGHDKEDTHRDRVCRYGLTARGSGSARARLTRTQPRRRSEGRRRATRSEGERRRVPVDTSKSGA